MLPCKRDVKGMVWDEDKDKNNDMSSLLFYPLLSSGPVSYCRLLSHSCLSMNVV